MCMRMQPVLCVAESLALERELPAAVPAALAERGFPPLSSAKKIKSSCHEFWELEFSDPVPPSLGPVGRRGSTSRAVLQILGAELSDKPVFAVQAPMSAASISQALALARAAGVEVPHLWFSGEIARRGPYRCLPFVVYEHISSDTVEDVVAAPSDQRARIERAAADALQAIPPQAGGEALAAYDDVHSFLAELQRLATEADAVDLSRPLARLAEECRTRWQLGAAPRGLAQDLSGANLLCSCIDQSAGKWALDSVIGWHAAVLCDFRLYSSDEPWDLIQAMSHVVKARWVCELSRRNPAVVPRCSVQELLEKHDECQAMLAQRGYLPAACVLPGCTTARLAETFPEELCAHY
jgi:hypothetical protein